MIEQKRRYYLVVTKANQQKIAKLIKLITDLQDISIFEILAGKNNDKLEEMDNYLDSNNG